MWGYLQLRAGDRKARRDEDFSCSQLSAYLAYMKMPTALAKPNAMKKTKT